MTKNEAREVAVEASGWTEPQSKLIYREGYAAGYDAATARTCEWVRVDAQRHRADVFHDVRTDEAVAASLLRLRWPCSHQGDEMTKDEAREKTVAMYEPICLMCRLRDENARLREALEHYADVKNWKCSLCVHDAEHVDGICCNDFFEPTIDGYEIARQALKESKDETR